MKVRVIAGVLVFAVVATGFSSVAYASEPTVTTFFSSEDSYIDNSQPATNFGDAVTMSIRDGKSMQRGLLRFDLSSIPPNAQISSAILKLSVASDGSSVAGDLSTVVGSWAENNVTYETAPQVGMLITPLPNPASSNSSVYVDLTSHIVGGSAIDFYITSSSHNRVNYYSRESSVAESPQLIVTWTVDDSLTPTVAVTATSTSVSIPTATMTPTYTSTPAPTATSTFITTSTPAWTSTSTSIPTVVPTSVFTATNTLTPITIPNETATVTDTPVDTPTGTATQSRTPVVTDTPISAVFTFTPVDDTFVYQNNGATNYGSVASLQTDNSPVKHILIKFNVTGINGGHIVSAKLRLYDVDPSNTGGDLYRVSDNNWQESTVTWNTAPAIDSTVLASLGVVSANNWYTVDLSSLIAGEGIYSLAITSTGSNGADYSSKEGTNPPQLIIETQQYALLPTATNTPTLTLTETSTETATSTFTPTLAPTSTWTPTSTFTNTPTLTPTETSTETATSTFTPTLAPTSTWTPTSTYTPTFTNTPTLTLTETSTETATSTFTPTLAPTSTWTPTSTYTPTFTNTPTLTPTETSTETATSTFTPTVTPTSTWTSTSTTGTGTFTATPSVLPSDSPSPTATFTATPVIFTLTPVDDTFVYQNYPTTNYGSGASLQTDGSPVKHILLKFDVVGINGAQVNTAKLRLYDVDPSTAGGDLYRVGDNNWQEGTVTWNNAPAADTTMIVSLGSVSTDNWYEIDLTSLIKSDGVYSLAIISTSSNGADYSSKEGANPPQLIVEAQNTFAPTATSTPAWVSTSSATPTQTVTPLPSESDPVIMAAGDIICDSLTTSSSGCQQMAASQVVVNQMPSAALILGDLCHTPSANCFDNYYAPSWGRLYSISYPVTGNHEYLVTGAIFYFDYWNGIGNMNGPAGNRSQGYYSYDIGAWHIIALNSQCSEAGGCNAGSPQYTWLQQDLQNHPALCTLAYYHIPVFSSGGRANNNMRQIFTLLYNNNVDVVLNGHDHIYERFALQDPNGWVDSFRGIREFIVGTGGANHTSISVVQPNSEAINTDTFGALQLTLHPNSYEWKFVPVAGKTFTDFGSTICH